MSDGLAGTLYKLNFKLDVAGVGFNETYHLTGDTPEVVRTKANSVATARRRILPADCAISYATIAKDDTRKDSKYVPTSLGAGLFINAGVDPEPTTVNDARTTVKIRFENDGGGSNVLQLVGVPDGVATANSLLVLPDSLTATFADADPAAGTLSSFKTQLENFMKIVTKYCVNVRTGHAPGMVYTYYAYTAAFYRGLGKKKGGRVFA